MIGQERACMPRDNTKTSTNTCTIIMQFCLLSVRLPSWSSEIIWNHQLKTRMQVSLRNQTNLPLRIVKRYRLSSKNNQLQVWLQISSVDPAHKSKRTLDEAILLASAWIPSRITHLMQPGIQVHLPPVIAPLTSMVWISSRSTRLCPTIKALINPKVSLIWSLQHREAYQGSKAMIGCTAASTGVIWLCKPIKSRCLTHLLCSPMTHEDRLTIIRGRMLDLHRRDSSCRMRETISKLEVDKSRVGKWTSWISSPIRRSITMRRRRLIRIRTQCRILIMLRLGLEPREVMRWSLISPIFPHWEQMNQELLQWDMPGKYWM